MAPSSSSSYDFFKSIPWTCNLLTPSTITKPATSRTPKSSSEDSLIATTLLTPTTIPHCLIYYTPPDTSSTSTLDKINVLFQLQSGLNGHPHILHGGITAVLMDESMGMMVQSAIEHANSVGGTTLGTGSFTKTLNVEYLAPVKTPGVVLVEVEVVERRGRGLRLVARLLQKERGAGEVGGELVVCAKGEGVFVTPKVGVVRL